MTNQDLKTLINLAYEQAEMMYATAYGEYFAKKGVEPFRDLLELDLIKFVTYLANVKGYASERELVLYKDCYHDPIYGGISAAQKLLDSNFEGEDFGNTVPLLLSVYCVIDIQLCKDGINFTGTGSKLYIDVFKSIGEFFLEFHNQIDMNEANVMCEFIEMLEKERTKSLFGTIDNEYLYQVEENDLNKNDSKSKQSNFSVSQRKKSSVDEKVKVLLENFEILKDNYENSRSMADIVIKMFEFDIDTAIDMWSYLLNVYETEAIWYGYDLTNHIIRGGANFIGEEEMDKLILSNPLFKKVLIAKKCAVMHTYALDIIRRKIENNELQIADELLQLIYENPDKEDSWYEIMNSVFPYSKNISAAAYELLEMWNDKVETKEQKAKLNIRMLEYTD